VNPEKKAETETAGPGDVRTSSEAGENSLFTGPSPQRKALEQTRAQKQYHFQWTEAAGNHIENSPATSAGKTAGITTCLAGQQKERNAWKTVAGVNNLLT
jgi:hypothetical protein